MEILLLALLTASTGTAFYWFMVFREMMLTMRELPSARDGLRLAEAKIGPDSPTVCAVIPAHNEGHAIGGLAESLRKQDYPNFHVIFALDRCTDDTEKVLRGVIRDDRRFTVYHITSCPPDWAGKVHAIWSAVSHCVPAQRADMLLFADADTTFDPSVVRASVALMRNRRLDLLSLMSTLSQETWYEKMVQPVTSFELLRQFPPRRVNRRVNKRALANGQFMLFRREAYEAIRGHAGVKDELLEDIAMAQHIKDEGYSGGFIIASGMLHCRMYETWPAFVRGWKRIYGELGNRRPNRLRRFALRVLAINAVLPMTALATVVVGVASGTALGRASAGMGLLALVIIFGTLIVSHRWGSISAKWVAAHPAAAVLVAWILWTSASDLASGREVVWGGRSYKRPPRYGRGVGAIRGLRLQTPVEEPARAKPGRGLDGLAEPLGETAAGKSASGVPVVDAGAEGKAGGGGGE